MSIAFLFPGQGAQFVGMGRALVEASPAAQALFAQSSEILGYDLSELCFQGPKERLDLTNFSQPALYVTSLAALEVLKQNSPEVVERCELAAGLSLGEYTALVFAGAMSFADGLRVVQARGEAMQAAADANPSGMVSALLLDLPQVEQVCAGATEAGPLWIANYLCPGNTVLSGSKAGCERAVTLIEAAQGRAIPLAVAGAFHTPLMQSACERLRAALAAVTIVSPRIPVYSNVDAQAHSDPAELRELLVRQVVQPVRWEESMRGMIGAGANSFYEVGPGKVLKGLLKRIERKLECTSVHEG